MGQGMEIKPINTAAYLQVNGMDCADCAAKVEKALKNLPGVKVAQLFFPQGKLNVEYDAMQNSVPSIVNVIESLGYQAQEIGAHGMLKPVQTTLLIGGLDCADCATQLEKRIALVPGVERAQVNFAASTLVVSGNGNNDAVLNAVRSLGYTGRPEQDWQARPLSISFMKSNKYVIPTAVSLVMLGLGFLFERLAVPGFVPTGFFIAGITLGGYMEFRTGLAVLLSIHEFDMNILMSIAVIGAAAIGQFEEAAAVVFLFSLGNALQGYTLEKTRNSIRSLMDLAPHEALVRRNGATMTLPVEKIKLNDIIIVRPGSKIAMDGLVVKGSSSVNQASITGESIPIAKNIGDEVYAGAINELGSIEVKVTHLARDNTISRLIAMVEEAQSQKAPTQQFIDKFARYYTPAVIAAAILVTTLPVLILQQPFTKWFYQAMAMLLVACPCALIISTPVSIVAAIGSAAKSGVLIKGGAYLEEAGRLSAIAFDKTGTLTTGLPAVTDVLPLNGNEAEIVGIAAAIETLAAHPLGDAIIRYTRAQGVHIPAADNFEAVLGQGAKARVDDKPYQIGNSKFIASTGISLAGIDTLISTLQDEGKTVMILGTEKEVSGVIAVADTMRENARTAVAQLKQAGIKKVIMLTGDNERTARAIAMRAGVDEFRSELLPEDKVGAMKQLLAENHKVAMVGDGVNDAPAMALSTVGIAMGAVGTDAALETANIVLMADDLTKLPYVINLSRRTLRIISQNVIFALAIKAAILLLVIPGWLTLWLAVAGDMGSSLLVTLNSMRLLRIKHQG